MLQRRIFERPSMVVVAHPDDEILGLGARFRQFANLQAIVHVTDGAPREGSDIARAGAANWLEYALQRRQELEQALQQAGATPLRLLCFWCPDQQASFRIRQHAQKLASLILRYRPAHVITHPYEGGHPDHDAVAASVHVAVRIVSATRNAAAPGIVEFASYHSGGPTGMETECFLPGHAIQTWNKELTAEEQRKKRQALDCFTSQQHVLCNFPLKQEPLRIAPEYDFTRPPHEGKLFYESQRWGMNGRQWRALARAALRESKLMAA